MAIIAKSTGIKSRFFSGMPVKAPPEGRELTACDVSVGAFFSFGDISTTPFVWENP